MVPFRIERPQNHHSNPSNTALAKKARTVGLLSTLWRLREKLTLTRLDALLRSEPYGEALAELTVETIQAWSDEGVPLGERRDETPREAIMRVFEGSPRRWLTSGFFIRHVGLARWTAQSELARLAELGLLEREGKKSSTRYRLAPYLRSRG